jgi:flagellar hook-length control protein FliK
VPAGAAGGGASLPATAPNAASAASVSSDASASVELAIVPTAANAVPGTGTVAAGADGAGGSPGPTHGATAAADVPGQSSAAARAASWMPQFLSAVTAGSGSDGVARAIAVPMSDPSWPQALAAQVHWMAGSQVQSATLRLSPEHLGPILVRIDLQQSQINVNFSAAHADTRAALTDAVPRLREMLAAGGLNLGQANVQQEGAGSGSHTPVVPGTWDAAETVDPVAVGSSRALGLVDEYV